MQAPSKSTALETQIALGLGGLTFIAGLLLGGRPPQPAPTPSSPLPAASQAATPTPHTPALNHAKATATATPTPSPSPTARPRDPRVDPRDPSATTTSVPPVKGPEGERAASRLLLTDVERGAQRLAHLGQGPLPNALRDLRPVLTLAAGWVERNAAARSWLDARQASPPPAGSVAAEELASWTRVIEAARSIRQAIADPRARPQSLERLKALPPAISADGLALLRLVDWLDHHQRWTRVGPLREQVKKLQADSLPRLRKGALGRLLRDEVRAVAAVISALLQDPQGCLIGALTHEVVTSLPRSEFIRTRLNVLPRGSSTTNMPGWGMLLELEQPLSPGQLIDVQVPGRHELTILPNRLKLNQQFKDVVWGKATRIYVEVRPQGLLVRIPGAKPEEFLSATTRAEAEVRYTIVLRGSVRAAQVALARIPHRSDELFRGER